MKTFTTSQLADIAAAIDALEPSFLSDARLEMAGLVGQESFATNYFRCLAAKAG